VINDNHLALKQGIQRIMNTKRTSIELIETAINEGWIKQLAFYHLLKNQFNNGCIYRYRSRMDEIAELLGISTKTLYNHLNFLRSKNLIVDHCRNIKIKSVREFTSRKKATIQLKNNENLFDVTCRLYAKIIEKKARQQAYKESVRRFGKSDRNIMKLCANPFRPSFSFRNIAKLLKISEYKAVKVMGNLNRLGIISIEKQKPKLISENFTALDYVVDLPGYRFNIGNKCFEVWGNRIDFLEYPVYLTRITIQQFKNQI
jgi:hypothetical protein